MATAAMVIIIIAIVVHIFLCCNCPFLLPSGCVNSRVFFCCWIVQCKLHPWLFGLIVPTLIALSWLSPFRRRWRHLRQIRDELSLWWSLFVFAPSVSHVSLGLTEHHVLGLFISPWFCFVWFCWSCDGFTSWFWFRETSKRRLQRKHHCTLKYLCRLNYYVSSLRPT